MFGILISNKHFCARCENTKCLFDIRIPNKTCVFFSFCFFVLFSMVRVHAKAGPWGRPHAAYPIGPFERTFFTLQKKNLSWGILHILVLNKRVRKPFQKKCKIFGTGSRRGATPGRLAAQNRWFLKGFLPEGRLHRTSNGWPLLSICSVRPWWTSWRLDLGRTHSFFADSLEETLLWQAWHKSKWEEK